MSDLFRKAINYLKLRSCELFKISKFKVYVFEIKEKYFNPEKIKRAKLFLRYIFKRKIYSQSNISYLMKCSLALSVIITSITIASGFTKNNAQAVYIEGEPVAIIDNADISETQFCSDINEKIEKATGVQTSIKETISLIPIIASSSEISPSDEILNSLANDLSYEVKACNINLDGKTLVSLKSEEEAKQVLEQIKKLRSEKCDGVVSCSFAEDVYLSEEYINSERVVSYSDAYDILNKNEVEEKSYTVVEGDTIEGIADKTDLSVSEILDLNPNIDENSIIHIGDKVVITEEKPLLSVETTVRKTYNEEIPFETEKVENDSEYKTYEKVLREGANGEKTVTAEVGYINGKETSRKILKESVIKEPVKEKVEVGTLTVPPKKATGVFKMPVSGRLSSGFGARWGTVHKGIDIAAPAGTPVYAADGGVVTFAGWNSGGYGYLVKISHENGKETYYAHNSKVAVSAGERVYQGQLVSYVGSTGDSTGNHLHFEVREGGVAHNPFDYLG